jgi:hypothetical protein
MDLQAAQQDMRQGYLDGGPGILASSLAWFAAAAVAWRLSPEQGVWALFIGGMAIHPVGILISKLLGARGGHDKANPLAGLALASTLWLIASLPLAFAASRLDLAWFFPAMMLVIGSRYTVFATLYGLRLYWMLGLVFAGVALGFTNAPPVASALAGAIIEMVTAAVLIARARLG